MTSGFGHQALISIISHLCFIALAWWALQSLNFDKFLRANHVFQARVLFILLSIIIGSSVSNFFPGLPIVVPAVANDFSVM